MADHEAQRASLQMAGKQLCTANTILQGVIVEVGKIKTMWAKED